MSCFLIVVVIWVFSVCLHEYGHAWVAYRGGDHTVEEKGYLSMNPIRYADPVTSFILPMVFMMVGGIGLPGGAVYINRHLLRSRNWETGVSLAGPAMILERETAQSCFLGSGGFDQQSIGSGCQFWNRGLLCLSILETMISVAPHRSEQSK